jgi:CrcB protein
MLNAMRLMSSGKIVEALGLIGLTLGLGVGAAALGFWLGQRVRPPTPPRSGP